MNKKYFTQKRFDIINLIPANCRRILDVGCGYGELGKVIKEKFGCEIFGIEKEPSARQYLEAIYNLFSIADVEQMNLSDFNTNFDCIIFADVLEHLRDPWGTLRYYTNYLASEGRIIISIPNARNIVLIYNLLVKGRWQYEDSGLLDKGHLRFFTRKESIQMVIDAGLEVETIASNHDRYSSLKNLLLKIPLLVIPDLSVCQFLIRAKKVVN